MRKFAGLILAAGLAGCSLVPADSSNVTGTLFVANKRDNSLSRIDLASGRQTLTVDTCADPHELSASPDAAQLVVACYSGSSLQVYQTADLARAYNIRLGDGARVHSAVWHGDGRIFAGSEGRGSLYVIGEQHGPDMSITEIAAGQAGPHMIAVSEDGLQAWGTEVSSGRVIRYDVAGGKVAVTRELGNEAEALALSPDGQTLWVGSNRDNVVYRLDAQTLETEALVSVGRVPIRIALNPQGTFAVTSNFGGGDLSVIDTATNMLTRTIPVSGEASAEQVTLLFSADGERLYAAETGANTIAEIDFATGEVLRRLPTGEGGDGMVIIG